MLTFTVEFSPAETRDYGSVLIPEGWFVIRHFPDGGREVVQRFNGPDAEDRARRTAAFYAR